MQHEVAPLQYMKQHKSFKTFTVCWMNIPMLRKLFLLSVDTGIRYEWLLDLHAAFKAKSREKNTQLALKLGNRRQNSQLSLLPPSFPCTQGICIWDYYFLPVSRLKLKSSKFWNDAFKTTQYYFSSKILKNWFATSFAQNQLQTEWMKQHGGIINFSLYNA